MNKLNLFFIVFLAFVGLACSGPATEAEIAAEREYHSIAPDTEPVVKSGVVVDNSPDYWTKCCESTLYEEDYSDLVPKTEADVADYVKSATESEAAFIESLSDDYEHIFQLEYAITFYSRAALKDAKYLPSAVLNLQRGIKYEAGPTYLAENTLALLEKFPGNKKLKSLLPGVRKILLTDLNENEHFDITKSYTTPESWSDDNVYGQGVYAIRNIDYLSRIAKKTGDKTGFAKWQRYKAEYELTGHSFDGVYAESNPKISYDIYLTLRDAASAKKAAVLVGHKYLEVYLQGAYNILGNLKRSHGLPYDLIQAKAWYKKGGLNDKQIDAIISEQARKQIDEINNCVGKGCGVYDARKHFLESFIS